MVHKLVCELMHLINESCFFNQWLIKLLHPFLIKIVFEHCSAHALPNKIYNLNGVALVAV